MALELQNGLSVSLGLDSSVLEASGAPEFILVKSSSGSGQISRLCKKSVAHEAKGSCPAELSSPAVAPKYPASSGPTVSSCPASSGLFPDPYVRVSAVPDPVFVVVSAPVSSVPVSPVLILPVFPDTISADVQDPVSAAVPDPVSVAVPDPVSAANPDSVSMAFLDPPVLDPALHSPVSVYRSTESF